MNHKWLQVIAIGLVILFGETDLCAQRIPAWTRRLTPASWKALVPKIHFKNNVKAQFIRFPRKTGTKKLVKQTDKKFIYHHVNYSDVFARAEKELLLKNSSPHTTLGKITYLHNKHSAFYNTIVDQDASAVSEVAFSKHQSTLEYVLTGLETYYLPHTQKKFVSVVFSSDEISRLQIQAQPQAYLLTVRELRFFSQLPTLAQQKEWVGSMVSYLQRNITETLIKDTFSLKPAEFENYYVQNMRLAYFQSLAGVLERATKKRPSAIIRYRRPLPFAGETTLLTDAQRAGYLQFMADTTHNPAFAKYIQQFNIDYGPYAAAEALEAPYETALEYSMYAPELLGIERGEYLRQLSSTTCLSELTPKIIELDAQLEALRQEPSSTPEFYAFYYRIYAQRQIYNTLVARARAMIEFENFRR